MGDAAALALGSRPELVGREAELARIDAFAGALSDGACALVISGEPGIGKSALWRAAVERCRSLKIGVLRTRPAEEEMPLALVGLVDLFQDAGLDVTAMQATDDPLVRGRAVLAVLRRLAEAGPTVVAIDDVQWLDSASARALRYGLRRLDSEPVGVLATRRSGPDSDEPLGLASALHARRCEELELGPLGVEALRRLVSGIVTAVSRPALRRIRETSGGNPLYAIELARALAGDAQARAAPHRVPLPDSLQAAIERRLETVPGELSPLLETAAALGPTTAGRLQETLGDASFPRLLAASEEHGLLVVDENLAVRFSHPLIASVVYGRMSALVRRTLHGRLAAEEADEDARARHLALSTDEPAEAVADLLERAARRAGARGSADLAAEFARHSLRLTPPAERDAGCRRALDEIESLAAAGEMSRALSLSNRLVATLPPEPGRARALVQRFYLEDDDLDTGEAFLLGALRDAGDDELLRCRVLDTLAWLRGNFRGDLHGALGCAREAVEIADREAEPELQILTESHLGHLEVLAGEPRPDRMARAALLEQQVGRPHLGAGPRALLAKQLFWSGDLDSARTLFSTAHADAVDADDELERTKRLYDLALVECAAGNLAAAEELVDRGLEAAADAENRYAGGWLLFPLALIETWVGRADDARETAGRLLSWAAGRGQRPWIVRAKGALGLLALSVDDSDTAATELGDAVRLLEEMGIGHPGAFSAPSDAVEALAAAGQVVAAEALLERLERQTAKLGHAWSQAAVERSRGALLQARGEAEAAASSFETAAVAFDGLGYGTDASRAVLGRGIALARSGRRNLAADVLADAAGRFAAMGATLWEARAVGELERTAPGRAAGELTAAEVRVAELVAQGMTNREIGQALFMSVATVESHLTRSYRKLGIRSRTELAGLVADGSVLVLEGDRRGPTV